MQRRTASGEATFERKDDQMFVVSDQPEQAIGSKFKAQAIGLVALAIAVGGGAIAAAVVALLRLSVTAGGSMCARTGRIILVAGLVLGAVYGCDCGPDTPDCENGSCDAGTVDAAALDAAADLDAAAADNIHSVDATVDASTHDQHNPVDAPAPDTSVPDTSVPDTSVPDATMPDTAAPDTWTCVPESAAELCTRNHKRCGALSALDNCGAGQTVNCGDCFCNDTIGAREACVQESGVAGNSAPENLQNLWPLATDYVWRYEGISRTRGNVISKLQIKVAAPTIYESQNVTPVDFVKNHASGYWGPGLNQNLRWMVVNWGQSSAPYLWARGDQRYDRDSLAHVERLRYDSLADPGNLPVAPNPNPNPPYALFPQTIVANQRNQILVNVIQTHHHYSHCQGDASCALVPYNHHVSWFVGITSARVLLPYSNGVWLDAKRVEYVEITLPDPAIETLVTPYQDPRPCRTKTNGEPYYIGVREDWYFVNGLGPALILTREVGYPSDYECITAVTTEPLTFANSDASVYLVEFGTDGYDPLWDF